MEKNSIYSQTIIIEDRFTEKISAPPQPLVILNATSYVEFNFSIDQILLQYFISITNIHKNLHIPFLILLLPWE